MHPLFTALAAFVALYAIATSAFPLQTGNSFPGGVQLGSVSNNGTECTVETVGLVVVDSETDSILVCFAPNGVPQWKSLEAVNATEISLLSRVAELEGQVHSLNTSLSLLLSYLGVSSNADCGTVSGSTREPFLTHCLKHTCQELQEAVPERDLPSGVYWMRNDDWSRPYQVFCDFDTLGGNWTVVLRYSGPTDIDTSSFFDAHLIGGKLHNSGEGSASTGSYTRTLPENTFDTVAVLCTDSIGLPIPETLRLQSAAEWIGTSMIYGVPYTSRQQRGVFGYTGFETLFHPDNADFRELNLIDTADEIDGATTGQKGYLVWRTGHHRCGENGEEISASRQLVMMVRESGEREIPTAECLSVAGETEMPNDWECLVESCDALNTLSGGNLTNGFYWVYDYLNQPQPERRMCLEGGWTVVFRYEADISTPALFGLMPGGVLSEYGSLTGGTYINPATRFSYTESAVGCLDAAGNIISNSMHTDTDWIGEGFLGGNGFPSPRQQVEPFGLIGTSYETLFHSSSASFTELNIIDTSSPEHYNTHGEGWSIWAGGAKECADATISASNRLFLAVK